MKDYLKTHSVNHLYLVFRYVYRYLDVINGNKYLRLVPTNESKKKIKKYEELWIKIRDFIRPITKNSDYDEKCTKIKFDSDDKLCLTKTKEILTITIVVIAVFL